jgi:ATP:cob(I)alamin adenosyltransferase
MEHKQKKNAGNAIPKPRERKRRPKPKPVMENKALIKTGEEKELAYRRQLEEIQKMEEEKKRDFVDDRGNDTSRNEAPETHEDIDHLNDHEDEEYHVEMRDGDRGMTKLRNGSTMRKSDPLIRTLGELDSVCVEIGRLKVLLGELVPKPGKKLPVWCVNNIQVNKAAQVTRFQKSIYNIRKELTSTDHVGVREEDVAEVEKLTMALDENIHPSNHRMSYGHNVCEIQCHAIRVAIRRAETYMADIYDQLDSKFCYQYINRLSDYFDVLAQAFNQAH